MGKVEKVVVLSVLFLMVVIFAVSMPDGSSSNVETRRVFAGEKDGKRSTQDQSLVSSGDWEKGAPSSAGKDRNPSSEPLGPRLRNAPAQLGTPQGATQGSLLGASSLGAGSATERVQPKARNTQDDLLAQNEAGNRPAAVPRTDGLLTADVRTPDSARAQAPAAQAEPRRILPGWSLVTLEGLADTPHPEYKTYIVSGEETFESVAARYYGDRKHANFLRRNNEGIRSLSVGQELFIPCINVAPASVTYFVQPGDSLWTIARDHYGDGTRWKEIFEANNKVLRSPDDLKTGQELMIP